MQSDQWLAQEKSPYAKVSAPCAYFGACGGCTLQDLAYADQAALKRARLRRWFEPLGWTAEIPLAVLDDPWRYRNKAEFTFGEVQGRMVLGYHAARSFHRIVDLDDCLLLPPQAMRAARQALQLAAHTGWPAYNAKTHRGVFRYALVRSSRLSGRVLVCVMTSSQAAEAAQGMSSFAHALRRECPEVAGVSWGLTDKPADIAVPDALRQLEGEAFLDEQVGPFRVELHPLSFLQPTLTQAERIYRAMADLLSEGPGAGGTAWDLYCGMGLIALHLSGRFRRLWGIDASPTNIELARRHAAANGVSNVEFLAGETETVLADRRFWLQEAKPDVIVIDPPRAGLHPDALHAILAARPKRVSYLSCNAASLVRDLGVLVRAFPRYRITHVSAYDMFAQTAHVEVLTLLERVG